MACVAHVVMTDRTTLGLLFTDALHARGRHVGEVLVIVRHRSVSTHAIRFDVEVRSGFQVRRRRSLVSVVLGVERACDGVCPKEHDLARFHAARRRTLGPILGHARHARLEQLMDV